MDSDGVDAVTELVALLFRYFGPNRTLFLIFGVVLALAIRRLYLDWRADRLTNEALAEKEQSIQRIASQERQWRVYFFVEKGGLSPEEAERIVHQNDYSTPKEARTALEGGTGSVPPVLGTPEPERNKGRKKLK